MLLQKIKKEINSHKLVYILLTIILLVGLFIRVYRTDQILGFYFDQGRDALAVWDLIYNHKVSLIGPTTGIAGIFRGPFYYWLIAPVYLLGRGNPVLVADFLALTAIIATGLIYFLGAKIQNRTTGLIAAIFSSLSFYLMIAGRWLSNPTPMLLLSLLLIWSMILVTKGKKWAWVAIAFLSGTSLFHFGSSGEFFYFPALGIFALWMWRKNKFPNLKILTISILAFGLTAAPLIIFDFRHDHILAHNIGQFLFGEQSFKASFTQVINTRLQFYYDVFTNKIFNSIHKEEINLLRVTVVLFILFLPKLLKNTSSRIVLLMLGSVVVGLLFFQGNEGNIYDYYLTGYYMIFVLLVALVLGNAWNYKLGKIFVVIFIYYFIANNLPIDRNKIVAGVDGPTTIEFGNQQQAVNWIYQDASGKAFSVDIYVPPVIPYAYDYLFKWIGTTKYYLPSDQQINPLYTLYEVDPPHPERLQAWLDRQKGIGKVEYEAQFGGIIVQKRTRL